MGTKIEIDQELLSCFVDDALEALQTFERSTVALSSDKTGECLQDLFRTAHNLKGASMCLGLEALGDFIHTVEDVIQGMINGIIRPTDKVISTLLSAQVTMNMWVRTLLTNISYTPEIAGVLNQLRSLGKDPVAGGPVVDQGTIDPTPTAEVEEIDSDDDDQDLEALFQLHRKIYEQEQETGSSPKRAMSHRASVSSEAEQRGKSTSARSRETLRISAQKLDELIQLVSELSIHQGMIQEARKQQELYSKSISRALQLSHKLVKDIHSKALELRMQPLAGLLQKLEKNALDLAMMQDKQVKIILEGSDVQLDKSVIEKIADPLVHVIRNSVDHGVESPAQRVAQGKPAEATIRISAVQDAVGVSIRVADDGQGMDDRVIFNAAVKKGIVPPEAQLTSDQIRRLIFVQGISTAAKITEISGRGVGMDIVLRTVQSLRGRIDIASTFGEGTSISITLPTSLSIVDALVVKVHDVRYAVPMHELTEIIDLSRYPIETSGTGSFMISLRGEVVPVETLAHYMPTPEYLATSARRAQASAAFCCPALLVREGAQAIAFAIDRVVSQQQIVVRPLSEQLEGLQGFRGCTILGDGEPGVILSLPELAKTYFAEVEAEGRIV